MIEVKHIQHALNTVVAHSQRAYPHEACGFILASGVVIPALNVVDKLHDQSVTTKTGFLIDDNSWWIASTQSSPISAIYHSHTNGDSNMSEADKLTLRWKDIAYLIIGLIDACPTSAKLFWWDDDLKHIALPL